MLSFFVPIGALTLKPGAYHTRPWETTRFNGFNYLDGQGTLVYHRRGSGVYRVTGPGWLRDRVRFVYDGFRRQRVVGPVFQGDHTTWTTVVAYLLPRLSRGWSPRVDPDENYLFWFVRGTTLFVDGRLTPWGLSVNTLHTGGVHLSSYGRPGWPTAVVGLPGWTTPEQDNTSTPPTGSASLLVWGTLWVTLVAERTYRFWRSRSLYNPTGLPTPLDSLGRWTQRAVFQVSPVQGLLEEW